MPTGLNFWGLRLPSAPFASNPTAHIATCLVFASLLGGCASSSSVRQAKLNDPIVVVTVQSTTPKKPDKPAPTKAEALEKRLKEVEMSGILSALSSADPDAPDGIFGGVVGGVVGGPGSGFGGLGLSGTGIGGGGTGHGIGLGSIGTIGHGSGGGYATIGIRSRSSERTKVKLGHVVINGTRTVDVVQRHVDDHRNDIQRCQHLEYAQSGNRWGSVTMRLTIESAGYVSDVQVYETTLNAPNLENCIAHVIGAFVFPAATSDTSATVLLPIVF